jgi:membrane protease YdiL (CAAX protease family)
MISDLHKRYTAKAVIILFLITSSLAVGYCALFGFPDFKNLDPHAAIPITIFGLFGMWIPGVVALFFAKKEGIRLKIFQKPDWMMLKTGLIAVGLYFLALIVAMPFNQFNEISPLKMGMAIGELFIEGLTFMPFITLGEELFWRGYLHEKMKHLGILKASLLIGVIWGIWHAPMILMGYHFPGLLGVFFMCLLCIVGSPLFFWFRERGKSIFIPAILHAMINDFSSLNFMLFKDPNPFFSGQGIGALVVLSLSSIFVLLLEHRKIANASIEEVS